MKLIGITRLCAALAAFCLSPAVSRADMEVSATVQIRATTDFEPGLRSYGTWVEVGTYGRCWRPAGVAAGWRPYGHGQWVWTDCGWYWHSTEPWAWACYHYGSWVPDPQHGGWIWVPGVEWAPAWVSWRVGGGHIGWAPVPPRGWLRAKHPTPDSFIFVRSDHFGSPVKPSMIITKDKVVLSKAPLVGGVKLETRNISASSQKVFVNNGPELEMVQKQTGRSFTEKPIQEAIRQTPVPASVKEKAVEARTASERREVREREKKEPRQDVAAHDRAPTHASGPSFDKSVRANGRGGGGGKGKH